MPDALSRFTLNEKFNDEKWELEGYVHFMKQEMKGLVESEKFREETEKDLRLREFSELIKKGWPKHKKQTSLNVRKFRNCRE